MAEKEEHKEFWINPTYLIDSIGGLIGMLGDIRNAIILTGLALGENSDVAVTARTNLELLANEKGLLKKWAAN
jgi:hypothetical protein